MSTTRKTNLAVAQPDGQWWCQYEDGTVWPVEVLGAAVWPGQWVIRPKSPAPDAGRQRIEPAGNIYDRSFQHPRIVEVAR